TPANRGQVKSKMGGAPAPGSALHKLDQAANHLSSRLPNPTPSPTWVEAKGANSYRYCALDNTATGGAAVKEAKTVTIDSGAPFLYATLTKSTESIDFPAGATLKITGPDGKTYSAAQKGCAISGIECLATHITRSLQISSSIEAP